MTILDPAIRDLVGHVLTALTAEENRRSFDDLAKRFARILADEIQQRQDKGLRIDVKNFVKDLGSGALNADLQHLFTWNHRFVAMLSEKNRRAAVETYDFVDSAMPRAAFNAKQMDVIASKKQEIMALKGHILDLGVYKGASTRALAAIFPHEVIHGFDSFEGLPEDWSHVLKGAFGDVKGVLPDMPGNVVLYKGWFEDTLPSWYENHRDRKISLLRVDCDIYSSTKTIFDALRPSIVRGTWIVFDELIGYRGWKDHEYRALTEFLDQTGMEFEYVAFGLTYAMGYLK